MKKQIFKIVYGFTLLMTLLTACKKYDDLIENPQPPVKSNVYSFVIDALPGEPAAGTTGVYALVTVAKANGEEVVKDKKLPLTFNGKYKTESLELPDGTYRVTKFLVIGDNNVTRFAAPVANAPKAAAVQKPLAIAFVLPQTAAITIPVEVLRLSSGDAPQSYGYPAGAFTDIIIEDVPETFVNVKVKAVVRVGHILYDSIPAALTLTSWDSKGQVHTKEIALNAGANALALPASHTKYILKVTKWGGVDEITLMPNDVHAGVTYVLNSNRAAKKLASETTYIFKDGIYQIHSKRNFAYNSSGMLQQVQHYSIQESSAHVTLTATDQYIYNNYQLQKVERFDHLNAVSKGTFQAFSYDAQGRITKMVQTYDVERTALSVRYSAGGGNSVITTDLLDGNDQPVLARYQYRFAGGNKLEARTNATTFTSNASYVYDFNINPFAQIQLPHLQFDNHSKNNLLASHVSTTAGGNTIVSKAAFQNTYDAEGYPLQVITSSVIGNNAPQTKTIYTYY